LIEFLRPRSRLLLFLLILALGIFARTWELRSLPPGLNEDEASSGVDAFSLYRFGVDRNGISFPVFMTSWGSGQNALPAYLMIPFIALGGLSPFTIRLPAWIGGILTLPLVYFVGKRAAGRDFGLWAMFLLAISPWHILISRWGFEGNLLPFIFSAAVLCLLKSTEEPRWFIAGMLLLGLCLYTYGPAYAVVPLFLLVAVPILVATRKLPPQVVLIGLGVLALAAIPIALFLAVNTFHWSSIHLGPITIPRLPSQPRYQAISAIFQSGLAQNLFQNLKDLASLLWQQEDGFFFNTVRPYGYFYTYTLPLAVIGLPALFPIHRAPLNPARKLLLTWLLVCLILGVLESVNIGRLNLIFIPLIFCVAAALAWVGQRSKVAAGAAVILLLGAFVLFTRDYHGPQYASAADREFSQGLLPAISFASQSPGQPVCVTKSVNMPYIYVLFSQRLDPRQYLPTLKYANPHGAFRQVTSLDRYSFGLDNCAQDSRTVYVLSRAGESPPASSATYPTAAFGEFTVFSPSLK
jgi:4-amino-4-deoxy-L-arabinose transferase-like glycosyltransferase